MNLTINNPTIHNKTITLVFLLLLYFTYSLDTLSFNFSFNTLLEEGMI